MQEKLVQMACGHAEAIEVFGNPETDARRIRWFEENGVCRDCYEKKMTSDYAVAQMEARKHGWAPLRGSDTQKPWAEMIRAEQMKELAAQLDIYGYGEEERASCLSYFACISSAAEWVNHRYDSPMYMVERWVSMTRIMQALPHGLARLSGTEEEVDYAARLRKEMLEGLLEYLDNYTRDRALKEECLAYYAAKTDAREWISLQETQTNLVYAWEKACGYDDGLFGKKADELAKAEKPTLASLKASKK